MLKKSFNHKIILLSALGITILINAPKLLFALRPRDDRLLLSWEFDLLSYSLQTLFTFGFTLALFYLNTRRRVFSRPLGKGIGLAAANLLAYILATGLFSSLDIWISQPDYQLSFVRGGYLIRNLLSTILVMLTAKILLLLEEHESNLVKRKTTEADKAKAEFNNLRNQVAPHVLFNSLNTINYLTRTNPEKSMTYVNQLSEFLRYNLQSNQQEIVTVASEIGNLQRYRALLNERYGGIIGLEIDIPESVQEKAILRLSLQELLENAVKHNVIRKSEPLLLRIDYLKAENALAVRNKILPKMGAAPSAGTGLHSLGRRYEHLFNRQVIINKANGCFTVKIPIRS